AANNEAAPTVLRSRHGERDRLLAELAANGVTAAPSQYAPDAVRVGAVAPHALRGYTAGSLSVQSEASQLVVCLLGVERGMRVLDVCAAPGGKATYIAELVGGRGQVVAFDRRRAGAAAVDASAHRLGIAGILAGVADARRLPLASDDTFDR